MALVSSNLDYNPGSNGRFCPRRYRWGPFGVGRFLERNFKPHPDADLALLQWHAEVAAAPLILVWFGFGVLPNIVMSFVISFFPVLLNTARGVSEVPYEMTELALTFNTPKWKRFAMIRVPYALPYIMTGVKLASIMAVTGAIVGEFIASEKGLAALILQAQSYLEMGAMVGALLWISVMAMILFGLINLAERLLMPWAKIRETD